MKHGISFLLILILSFNEHSISAQTTSLKINAADKITVFSLPDLEAMPQTTLSIKGEDGTQHNYSGVEMQLLLSKADVSFNKEVRKKTLDSYMYIKAADGYSVLYALAEIDSSLSSKQIILAIKKDDNLLPQNAASFQIITTGEKIHARMIRMVTEIDVRKAE